MLPQNYVSEMAHWYVCVKMLIVHVETERGKGFKSGLCMEGWVRQHEGEGEWYEAWMRGGDTLWVGETA